VYRALFQLVLSRLPAETAHHFAFGALRTAARVPGVQQLLRAALAPKDPILEVRALGLTFPGPLGLAAGFDKNAEGPDALTALGFGCVEIGTVTAKPQPGNDVPRLFPLPEDRALVNRMGFNHDGAVIVAERLAARRRTTALGVNIGKTKVVPEDQAAADYAESAKALGPHAGYCVVNVSSPNTPGLRDLQRTEALRPVLSAVRIALDEASPGRVPLLVKIAPDLADADVEAVADLALELGLDGIVATNTTISREGLASPNDAVAACGAGGLSGAPVKRRALEVLALLYKRTAGKLCLVGVGGIENADDAFDRIAHGATLLQLYTAFIYEGPLAAFRIHHGLAARMRREGYASIDALVGSAA
jgi:dihydroorotate dehydrogenase